MNSLINNSKCNEMIILFLCLLISFCLMFYTFDQKSLWIDEIHTYNDSRDDLGDQLKFYEKNPNYLHPPLFFVLTHIFYPFTKPERDLRIIPLIFGTLSIPMIYLLAKEFSPSIALPSALSLTFMAYHVSLSQDGRSYSMLMFLGMAGLYSLMRHLITSENKYLLLTAFLFSVLFYISYSSIPFIILSQLLWFYRINGEVKKPTLSSFYILNGSILLLCLPWIFFIVLSYSGQAIIDPDHTKFQISFWNMIYGVFNDWALQIPLIITAAVLFILFPIFSEEKLNPLILVAVLGTPLISLYSFCKLFNITHFFTSRYLVNFLPIFLITLFLSMHTIEVKFKGLRNVLRLKLFFTLFFIITNLIVLNLYYHSEKQDFRKLANYLKGNLHDGDKIIVGLVEYIPGLLHYFGIDPKGRLHPIYSRMISKNETEYTVYLILDNRKFTISYSKSYWIHYLLDKNRLWYVAGKNLAKEIKKISRFILRGYFDGSFCNFDRFPVDASMHLFLWDPHSPGEKGIDMPIE